MSKKREKRRDAGAPPGPSTDRTVLAQVVALEEMTFSDLRNEFRALYGKEPPTRSRKQVIARLAYRIQEIAYGGLSAEAKERLTAIAVAHGAPGKEKEEPRERKGAPAPGTKLVREYLGERHEVVVLEKGFQYRDGVFRSLSAIAKAITGSHMSGPAFFGTRQVAADNNADANTGRPSGSPPVGRSRRKAR